MAEIIKPPKHGKWCIELTCKFKHCKAEFRAFQEDIKIDWWDDERFVFTICPCCKAHNKLSWSDVPVT